MNSLVVTTTIRGNSKTQIWDTDAPLALGHPFQWVMERTEDGVRVRNITGRSDILQTGGLTQITQEKLINGTEFEIPSLGNGKNHSPVKVRLRPVMELKPAFLNTQGNALWAYACAGHWVLNSQPVGEAYSGVFQKKVAFILRKAGESFSVEAKNPGIRITKSNRTLAESKFEIKAIELSELEIKLGNHNWRFAAVNAPAIPTSSTIRTDDETLWFKKSLRYTAIGLAIFGVITYFWPKTVEDAKDLVPPQFAKIVLSQPKAQSASSSSSSPIAKADPNSNVPKKVQEAAVVQAFRAKALQNSVSSLLKGGMTTLLAQSDFVSGNHNAAKEMFSGKSSALQPTTNNTGVNGQKNVDVASVGGSVGNGQKVGYGKGEHAGVKGQGNAFVAMDIPGASVEEGLTKDEVGEVIHRHMSEVRYCYESAMLRTPDVEGKLVTNFTIGASGMVKSTEIKSSTLPDPRLDDCILRRLVTWKFPNTKGGVDVAVSYPFIFKTLGR